VMSQAAGAFGSDFLAHAVETSNAIQRLTSVPPSEGRLP